jgi:hypothetical protein
LYSEIAPAVERIQGWGFDWSRVRFLTLTLPNTESAHEGIERLSAAWHRMLANRRFSRLIAGGFRCFEVKAGKDGKWNVHLHAIAWTWAQGAPYAVMRAVWDRAARAAEGTTLNQQFDELRKKAKPRKGETKASAAARYLVKYVAKWEDLTEAGNAPGGLPHLLAALDGRRMFSAWGVGAAARRIHRHESPRWLGAVQRHIDGYRDKAGNLPEEAMMEGPGWSGLIRIPRPPVPVALSEHEIPDLVDHVPEKIRRVHHGRALDQYDWKAIPTQGRDLGKWISWEETRQKARERIREASPSRREFQRAWKAWRAENARFERKPTPFKWGSFYSEARKTWTKEAGSLLGVREMGSLGASLWSKVHNPSDEPALPVTDARHWSAQLAHAVTAARKSVTSRLAHASRENRCDIIRALPVHIARHFLEITHDGTHDAPKCESDGGREIRLTYADDWE